MMNKKRFIVMCLSTIILAATSAVALALFTPLGAALKNTTGVTPATPTFMFNEQSAAGWWAAENYNSKENVAEDYQGATPVDKLPVASRVIFQSRDTSVDSCFITYSYYDYAADVDVLVAKMERDAAASTDLIYNKQPSQPLTIDTFEGVKSYELHAYTLTGPASQQSQRGVSYGYIGMSNGYIAIQGSCPEGDQLAGTLAAMSSMSLVK